MLSKPPFLLYTNNNSSSSLPKTSIKQENKLKSIFSRIPGNVIRKNHELQKIAYPAPKIIYDVITENKRPIMIDLTNNMTHNQEKLVSNLNSFKEMLYDFNQEGEELLGNFSEVQEENEQFSHNYKKIQKDKSKFNTGTYLDHDYLIKIASKYTDRGIKVPKISSEKSVFSGNPLILGGSELEDFIVYNLGDRKKSSIFLKKVENLVRRKETGNFLLNDAEIKKMDNIIKNEKPKGYIPPEILIPKLKKEIESYQQAIENVKNLEIFLEPKKQDNKINKKENNSLFISPRFNRNRSVSNILENRKIRFENNNKIRIKKKLSFLNKINNNILLSKNYSNSNIKNVQSSISTGVYLSPKKSSEESTRIFSSKLMKSNINSAVSRNKSKISKFSPLPSPIYRNNNSNKVNFSLINDLYSGKRRINSNSSIEANNSINKNIKKERLFSMNPINRNRNKEIKINKDRILSVNDINEVKKRLSLKSNSMDLISEKRNSLSKISSNNLENFVDKDNNISKDEISEENELKLLNKELGEEDEEDEKEEGNLKKKININILDNNFDKISPKINKDNNEKKENDIPKNDSIQINQINSDLNIDPEKQKRIENYIRTEKIYNSILGEGYKSRRLNNEIDNFLKSKGYELSKKIINKDAFLNILKAKKKMSERNYLMEEFNIRSRDLGKVFLTPNQRRILDKNKDFLKKIEENEFRFKKILLEKNVQKDNEDFDL